MTEDEYAALAHARKLDLAWSLFPNDVIEAIKAARQISENLPQPANSKEEPWPPMRTGYRT
ncbi:hypothetical protein EN943_37085 [Mesorhizobium sp. M7A.F.Ca.US.006.01.1.1]|uniref:hypothetical protein n=1 Tax=Mesorhizobium sp. M7A.F.Ca.US.006.01.1.1 TaxID=2496707 RepID=UPI000FCBCC90|nr:hypothetical protein [Mesorhizobium sp. M7A.F.Ca.US.006.01.1.1]RUZ69386.1 hypothetical protein EN943_37085 [Mesorhizobium sp. M7A.F.Ca.US.006.01.1.1]